MYNESINFISIYPEVLLIFSLSILLTYLVIFDYFSNYKIVLIKLTSFLSVLILVFILLLFLNDSNLNYLIFQSLLKNDILSLFSKFIILFFSIFLFILSIDYLSKENIINYEYFIIILLAILGLMLLVTSYDLISMYLAIELQSLCFYILATFKQYTNFSTEAGLKYFILGAFSSGILLFGCSILYGFTGVTDFFSFQLILQNKELNNDITNVLLIGTLFIVISLLFKLAAAPFHM